MQIQSNFRVYVRKQDKSLCRFDVDIENPVPTSYTEAIQTVSEACQASEERFMLPVLSVIDKCLGEPVKPIKID